MVLRAWWQAPDARSTFARRTVGGIRISATLRGWASGLVTWRPVVHEPVLILGLLPSCLALVGLVSSRRFRVGSGSVRVPVGQYAGTRLAAALAPLTHPPAIVFATVGGQMCVGSPATSPVRESSFGLAL